MRQGKAFAFGDFRLDAGNAQLRDGVREVALRPKAFAVLLHLVEHAGQLVTKQELLDAVWPATFVTDGVLKDSIRQLRDALGDDADSPRFIETAHRRGYRFIGRLSPDGAAAPTTGEASSATIQTASPIGSGVLGRDAELARLNSWLERALQGERQLVFVTGEPGIGKTTLVSAVGDHASSRGMWMAWGQCLEHYGAGEAYLPVLDGLSRLGRTAGNERITDILRRHAPTWLLELPSLIPTAERESVRQHVTGATRERMLRELADAIEAITAEAPLMIVLEDLHWSDYSTLDLIAYLARRRDRARLIIIGTYRPVDVILGDHPLKAVKRELQAHGLCRELPLEYLTEAAVEQFLGVMLPGHELPKWLARLVHRRTEGNPLFMVNLVEYLIAERMIVQTGGQWLLEGTFAEIESGIPESVRQLIERQIDRLSEDERRVLEGASVVGMECSSIAIAAGLDEPTEWVEQHCEALVRRHQFLSPPWLVELPDGTITPRYRFSHVLYLEVPYRLLPAMRRSQIHRRIGHRGEAIYGASVGEIAAELAMHFEQGKDPPRAVRYLLMAAENAGQRSAHREAEALARRGLSALATLDASPVRDQQELSLRMILGGAVMSLQGFAADEVKDIYERAIQLCGGQTSSRLAAVAHWRLAVFYYFHADIRRCHEIAAQIVDRAERVADLLSASEGRSALGVTLVELGEFSAALEQFATVGALCEAQPGRLGQAFAGQDPAITSECYAARSLWTLGYPDRALVRAGRARALASSQSPAENQVIASYFTAHLHQLRGEAKQAREHAESAIAIADDHGLSLWLTLARGIRGWARVEQGECDDGLDEFRRALTAYEATGARLWRAQLLGWLAQALARAGRHDEGMDAAVDALNLVRDAGAEGSFADLLRVEGDLLLARAIANGEHDVRHAEKSLTRALAMAHGQNARSWELRAATSLARVYAYRDKHADAVRVLMPVISWFTEGHDTADLRAAHAVVRDLSGVAPVHES